MTTAAKKHIQKSQRLHRDFDELGDAEVADDKLLTTWTLLTHKTWSLLYSEIAADKIK